MKKLKLYFYPVLLLSLLASCGESSLPLPSEGEGSPAAAADERELLLTLQNRLVTGTSGVRATEIATQEEKRIDALDIYVFGSKELDGEYTFQERFCYRSDGTLVAGSKNVIVQGGDGTTSTPTVLLRPKKGLFVKLYCVANQTELYRLDATDPDNPSYVAYTDFTPLVQSAPGDPAHNQITMGIPTESDFCKLVTKVIDPVRETDVLLPGIPMLGANSTAIDLQDFSLASRLYAGIKLVRAVARFDIVNDAAKSRFTVEGVSMGNGRSTSNLFPQEALLSAKGELITWPSRDVTALTDLNKGTQKSAFYSYASPKEDAGYLILKGKYNMNLTEQVDVSYNIDFSQVKNGTGSYIEINPNHRYTVTITDASPYHVDFNIRVADWDEGEDLGEYVPENGVSAELTFTGTGGTYDEITKIVTMSRTGGENFTVEAKSNALLTAKILYSDKGNEWLSVSEVTMASLEDDAFWSQTGTCTVTVGNEAYAAYPDATLRLTNAANGTTRDIKIKAAAEVVPGP